MVSGESDMYFGTEWAAEGEGAGKNFWPAEGGNFFFCTPYVCTQDAQIFVENSNVGEKHKKNNSTP